MMKQMITEQLMVLLTFHKNLNGATYTQGVVLLYKISATLTPTIYT